MIDLELSWRQAGVAATGLIVASVALRAARKPRLAAIAVFTQESGLILGLFALWQLAGSLASVSPDGALARSRWIWHFERVVHLPSETSTQKVILHHPLVVQFWNLYYDSLHFPVLVATLIWLFVRHRDRYKRLRTTLVGLTGACLLVQLIPVAPPRMLPETHLVDTAIKYHQSVYSSVAGFDADQLSAMPSVHVAWAVLVAWAVITRSTSRWRWLILLHPAITVFVVVATGNHFWADGLVAASVVALVLAAQTLVIRRAVAHRSPPLPALRQRHYEPQDDQHAGQHRGDHARSDRAGDEIRDEQHRHQHCAAHRG